MLKLRTDTKYVTPDGKLTQAGVEAFQGLLDAQAKNIATNATNIAVLQAADATEAANAPGSAPRYACRAWVDFNGTGTPAIRASGNVSSITDNGVGDYTINFTTAMPDANYAVVCGGRYDTSNANAGTPGIGIRRITGAKTTTAVRIAVSNTGTSEGYDADIITVAIFR